MSVCFVFGFVLGGFHLRERHALGEAPSRG